MVLSTYELTAAAGWFKHTEDLSRWYRSVSRSQLPGQIHQYLLQCTRGRSVTVEVFFSELAEHLHCSVDWICRLLKRESCQKLFKIVHWFKGQAVHIIPLLPEPEDKSPTPGTNQSQIEDIHPKTGALIPGVAVASLRDSEINNQGSVENAENSDLEVNQEEPPILPADSQMEKRPSSQKAESLAQASNLGKDKSSVPRLTELQVERLKQLRSQCSLQAIDQELVELAIAATPSIFQGIVAEFQRQRRKIRSAIAWLKVAFRKGYVPQKREQRSRYFVVGSDGELREAEPSTPLVALPFGYVHPEERVGHRNDSTKTAAIRQQIRERLKRSVRSK